MKRQNWKKHDAAPWWTAGVFALLFACVLLGLHSTGDTVGSSGRENAERAVRRAAVTCYALEGAYPESYDYLREHYGVRVNLKRYDVHYSIFASNLMPDVTVTER